MGTEAGVRYLVVAVCQSGARVARSGAKVFVLFIGAADCLEIVIGAPGAEQTRHSEHVSHLGAFRIERLEAGSCPRSAWRWARNSPLDCADLLERCIALRAEILAAQRKRR
jgi:hypothetical protein